MAHADFPDLEGGHEKDNADEGREPLQDNRKPEGIAAFEYGQCGQVIYTREGYDVSEKFAKVRAVNGQRILRGLHAAISHGVHQFEGFCGPKRKGGLQDDEADKEAGPAKDGEEHETALGDRPRDVEGVARPEEDARALKQTPHAAEGQFVSGELQGRAAGAKQEAVEIAAFDHGAEDVKAARGSVGK